MSSRSRSRSPARTAVGHFPQNVLSRSGINGYVEPPHTPIYDNMIIAGQETTIRFLENPSNRANCKHSVRMMNGMSYGKEVVDCYRVETTSHFTPEEEKKISNKVFSFEYSPSSKRVMIIKVFQSRYNSYHILGFDISAKEIVGLIILFAAAVFFCWMAVQVYPSAPIQQAN